MRFGDINLFMLMWLALAVFIFYLIADKKRKRMMSNFASGILQKDIAGSFNLSRRKLKNSLVTLSVFLLVVALMRPQLGFKWQEVKRQGIEILIALDTSKSMLAEDVLPNRLDRAKLAIKDLVKKLRGDKVGLIVFSGTAFLQCPLTVDYNGFLLALDDVDVNSIPVGGTSLASAIYKAIESYDREENDQKILIVITDGEDLEGGVERAIERAKYKGVKISCVGIGSPEGELIPLTEEEKGKGFLKDSKGNVVKTRLQEDVLQRIALETGGMYVRATGAEFGLDLIYEEKLSKLEKQEFKSKMEKRYNERFQYPLGLAILLLLLEPLIGDRKKETM